METLRQISEFLEYYVWQIGIPVGDETIPAVAIALIGVGVFLSIRLGLIQIRRLGHGFGVTSGKYDDPNEPGDVSHFQALTTALSATVGIGNIGGVAIAIHLGGPGALFWMWITAFVGMATKYSEVTLAQHYRNVEGVDRDPHKWEGTVSGGPMYYIEKGLGRKWKPLAIYFAFLLSITAFLTGNAAQANTVADAMQTDFGIARWVTGLVTASLVAAVILGGITRIGKVTGVLAPVMAVIYVTGALVILALNIGEVPGAMGTIFREAFEPTAGIAGTGAGAFVVTMMWGVRRGLFSNEAGQGSAPIAHAAAKTDEPVSEGVVALLEPFIDTIVICTLTGMVIVSTGVYKEAVPTPIELSGGDLTYVLDDNHRFHQLSAEETPAAITVVAGRQTGPGDARLAWHEVPVRQLFVDEPQTVPFSGRILPAENRAVADDGSSYEVLYGDAVENSAPLTKLGFERGLPGRWGGLIVVVSVLLFAISTAISWSYYGDRCARYLLGSRAVLPYKLVFVGMHFAGAVLPLTLIWELGDVFLGMVILPNLLALVLLSPKLVELTRSYFERKPWVENAEVHRRLREEKRRRQ